MSWPIPLLLLGACSPEARYQRIVDGVDSPGAILTTRDARGARWQGASGRARDDEPMTVGHQTLVGSNTKMMTATIVLQLVDEGRLSLDDSAADWVEGLRSDVTVRDLLQHTSGMGDYFDHPTLQDGPASRADEYWTPAQLLAMGREVRDDGPAVPGTYANTNFVAAGMLVEAIEQRPFEQVIADRIFEPLQMTHSGLLISGDPMPDVVAWGDGGALGVVTRYDPSVGWAAGSVYATGADLSRFLDAMITGELLSDAMHAAQLTPVVVDLLLGDELDQRYGLGVMMVGVGDVEVYGHWGGVDGFTTAAFVDPATHAQAVLQVNQGAADIAAPALRALRIASGQ